MKKDHYHYWVSYFHKVDGMWGMGGTECKGLKKFQTKDIRCLSDQIKSKHNLEGITIIAFSEMGCDCDE